MDIQKLKALLKQGEGPKLDYKETIDIEFESGKKEIAKDVIAIANSQGGRGHLIVGVKDKTKEIVGIDPASLDEERIQQIISQRADPPINIRVEYIEIQQKVIGVITIFRSNNRPHQMRQTGAFYIRRGSTTDVARRDEIASILQSSGIINHEQFPMYNVSMDVLNKDLIEDYLEKTNIPLGSDDKILMSDLGIVHYDRDSEQYYPTFGGLLLFCENPQRYIPYTGIKLVYFEDKKRREIYFNGNILRLLDSTMEYLKELIKDENYPIDSIEEAIANALVHRDYFDQTREIVVSIGPKSIEVSNPGAISYKDRVSQILQENNPIRRNSWLYHRVLIIDDKKRFMKSGVGVAKINNSFKDIGKVKLINNKRDNIFKIVLPRA